MGYKSVIIGTAGHIDHGKSSLVKALTGIDPDRLKEEKSKGITIDLGFAHFKADNLVISFIDVPGHESLVKNMIAGATNFNIALLVIDAKEGIKAQTIEHCNIINYLNVENLIIALNKIDLVDNSLINQRINEINLFLSKYNFKNIDLIKTSINDKTTMENLKNTIIKYAKNYYDNKIHYPFLMHIDRVFSLRGLGTVITGTSTFGTLKQNELITISPLNKTAKIKSLQNHGQPIEKILPNMRVAINLSDIKKDEILRGHIVHKGDYYSTQVFYSQIKLFENIHKNFTIKTNKKYLLFFGTDSTYAKIILLDKKEIKKGEEAFAKIIVEKDIITYPTEKMLIRSGSPQLTIAGITTLFCDDINLNKKDLISFLNTIAKKDYKTALSILLKNTGYYIFKNQHQFLHLTTDEFANLLNELNISKLSNVIFYKNKINYIIENILNKIKFSEIISLSEFENFNQLPELLKNYVIDTIKEKLPKNEYTITGYIINKNKLTPFEKKAYDILNTMKQNLSITNATNISETFNIPKNEAEKIIVFLQNRDKLKKLADNIYIPVNSLNKILSSCIDLAKKEGYIDIKNIKNVVEAPRKTIIAILEYLDKTNHFIKKDNKRFLKQ
ncbi:selenocysteine-specific translation elongation factor [Deferribacter thermophilus]|uniref:selenocysteine-specific translation elongation factor n=1 Tax=Deferribacter thermophilus TaxID=53573 RepID=UPI003C1A4309